MISQSVNISSDGEYGSEYGVLTRCGCTGRIAHDEVNNSSSKLVQRHAPRTQHPGGRDT